MPFADGHLKIVGNRRTHKKVKPSAPFLRYQVARLDCFNLSGEGVQNKRMDPDILDSTRLSQAPCCHFQRKIVPPVTPLAPCSVCAVTLVPPTCSCFDFFNTFDPPLRGQHGLITHTLLGTQRLLFFRCVMRELVE